MSRCEWAEARSDGPSLCRVVFAIKVIDGKIRRPFSPLKDLSPVWIFCRAVFFSYSFHGTFDLEPLSSQGFETVLFFSAPLPLLFCNHEGGFVMTAFGILLQCSTQHLFLALYLCFKGWPELLLDYLSFVADHLFAQCAPRRTALLSIKTTSCLHF